MFPNRAELHVFHRQFYCSRFHGVLLALSGLNAALRSECGSRFLKWKSLLLTPVHANVQSRVVIMTCRLLNRLDWHINVASTCIA